MATMSLIITTLKAPQKSTIDIRSDNSSKLISLLISTYQSTIISWVRVYLINTGYGSVFYDGN
jgi:hypothetical protein